MRDGLLDPVGAPSGVAGRPSSVQIGEVIAVNADDLTIDVRLLTSRAVNIHVPYPMWWLPSVGERCLIEDRDGNPQTPICLGFFAPKDGSAAGPQTRFTIAATGLPKASTTQLGITELASAPADPNTPIAIGDNDPRVPTQPENDALAGTSGAPSGTNKYVTDQDPRNSNARAPTAHAASHASGGTDPVTLAESQVTNLVADLAAKQATSQKDQPNGYPSLDGSGKVPIAEIPSGGSPGGAAGGDLSGTYPNPLLGTLARTTAGTVVYLAQVTGDAVARYALNADGSQEWGDGTNPRDITLSRIAGPQLLVSKALQVNGISTGQTAFTSPNNRINSFGMAALSNVILAIGANASGNVPLLIRGAGGASDLFQVQDSLPQTLVSIASDGTLKLLPNGGIGTTVALTLGGGRFRIRYDGSAACIIDDGGVAKPIYVQSTHPASALIAQALVAGAVALVARSGPSNPGGDLFQAQDTNGNVKLRVASDGTLEASFATQVGSRALTFPGGGGGLTFDVNGAGLPFWPTALTTAYLLQPDGDGGSTWQPVSGLTLAEGQITGLVTDLAATEKTANKDQPGGYPSLDGTGKVPIGELPPYPTSLPPSGQAVGDLGGTYPALRPWLDHLLGTVGLGSLWRLGEASGATTAADAIGSNPGTYGAGVTRGVPGLIATDADTAASFPGSGTTGTVTLGAGLPSGGPLSVEAWVNPTSVSGANIRILSRTSSWSFGRQGAHLLFTAAGVKDYITVGSYLTPGVKTHVGAVFRADNSVDFYVNGAFVENVAAGGAIAAGTNTGFIGGASANSELWSGTIDEVAVYNVALVPAVFADHFAAAATPTVTTQGPNVERVSSNGLIFDAGGAGVTFPASGGLVFGTPMPAGQLLTADGEGRSTWSPQSILAIAESQVTNLVADLAATEKTANKDQPNGYAGLDASGLLKTVPAGIEVGKAVQVGSRTLTFPASGSGLTFDVNGAGLPFSPTALPTGYQLITDGDGASTWGAMNTYGPFASRPAASLANVAFTYLCADLIFDPAGAGLTFDPAGAGLTFGRHDGETYESDGSAWSQSSVGTGDPRIPTQDENDALQGTSGAPSNTNRYVTNSDSRIAQAAQFTSATGAIIFPASGAGVTFDAGGLGVSFGSPVPTGKALLSDGASGIDWGDVPTRQEFDQLRVRVDQPAFAPLYTALPTGLPEGVVIHFLADPAAGVVWQLRYSPSASPTYPWLYVGGPDLVAESTTNVGSYGTTYATVGTLGSLPSLQLPAVAGDFDITPYSHGLFTDTVQAYGWLSYKIGAAAAVDGDGLVSRAATTQNAAQSLSFTRRKTALAASTLLQLQARSSAGLCFPNDNATEAVGIRARPVRVG